MERTKVLLDLIREEVRKEILEEESIKNKNKTPLLCVYGGNTYTHLDTFCEKNVEYFGLSSDNFKRSLYQKGLIDYNGSKYIPFDGMEAIAILNNGKLYINRDRIDSMLMLYLIERMSIKNMRDAFEEKLKSNKQDFVQELYDVSNAEFQRKSPVFQDLRLGENKIAKIDM